MQFLARMKFVNFVINSFYYINAIFAISKLNQIVTYRINAILAIIRILVKKEEFYESNN